MNTRRLYRCRTDRKIAGVASGIAEYFELDPTAVRVAWIVSVLFGGFTIPLYVILAIVMPIEPLAATAAPSPRPTADEAVTDETVTTDAAADAEAGTPIDRFPARSSVHAHGQVPAGSWAASPVHEHRAATEPSAPGRTGFVVGIVLVVFGAVALAGQLLPGWLTGVALGPAFILALGIALVVAGSRRTAAPR
ncbi:MAG: PspC domain-containing protein [Chloroflexota bacterium]